MSETIKSAELIKYNANSAGNRTGDCVKRALSLAFGIDYKELSKQLLQEMHNQNQQQWNISPVYDKLIKRYGGSSRTVQPNTATVDAQGVTRDGAITLNDWADAHDQGTFLVCTGDTPNGRSNHIVCIIDGKVYDSWDSLQKYVKYYYTFDHAVERNYVDIDIHEYLEDIVDITLQEILRISDKYAWRQYMNTRSTGVRTKTNSDNRYNAKVYCDLYLNPRPYSDREDQYAFNFGITLPIDVKEDAIIPLIQKTAKQRVYDRLWSVNEQEKKKEEAYEYSGDNNNYVRFNSDLARRWFKSLPGWVQGIATYVSIDRPGMYSDSYTIDATDGGVPITFEAYTSDDMKTVLNHYKTTGEILAPYDV